MPQRLTDVLTHYFVPLAIVMYIYGGIRHLLYFARTGGEGPFLQVYQLTFYHVNYVEFGFVKRGVVATLFHPFIADLPADGSTSIAILIAVDVAIVLGLIMLVHRLIGRTLDAPSGAWVRLIVILAPPAIAQSGLHFLRLDHWIFLCYALAGIAVVTHRYLAAGVLLGLGILIHEVMAVFAVPVILAAAYQQGTSWRRIAMLAVPAGLAAAGIALFGDGSVPEIRAGLPERLRFAVGVWDRPLVQPAQTFPPYWYAILVFYFSVPAIVLASFYRQNRYRFDLLFLAPFACLALFVLGLDYFRWCNIFLVSVLGAMLLKAAAQEDLPQWRPTGPVLALVLVYCVPLGAIGVISPLPTLHAVLEGGF